MSLDAVRAVARAEWAGRRRSLLAVGLVAGLLGGLVVGGAGLARRTATAPERLAAEVAAGDALVTVFGQSPAAARIDALPEVERSWAAGLSVGRLEGPGVVYLGLLAGPERPPGLFEPVLTEGRPPDPGAEDEALLLEPAADALGLGPGDVVTLAMLTAEEVSQFDVGFGDPDGPTVELTVTGVARIPPGTVESAVVLATPAFAARHGDVAAGSIRFVALDRGRASVGAFTAAVADLEDEIGTRPGSEEFPPATVVDAHAGVDEARSSASVLVAGLVAAVAVATAAGLLALAQALARHHAASAADQRVESALGLTRGERTLARVLPAVVPSLVAGAIAAGVAVALAGVEPPGAVRRLEPDPGWAPDLAVVATGALLVGLAVALLAAATAWRAGAGPTRPVPGDGVVLHLSALPLRAGWARAGALFALSPGGGRDRRVPVRSALVGAVVGVAGLVAATTFGASLDRLVASPARWGWEADLVVVDVTDEGLAELEADERVEAVAEVPSGQVVVGGADAVAYAVVPVAGDLGWVLHEGREPDAPDEVVLGTTLADRLEVSPGDEVDVTGGRYRVVGVGLGPPLGGEALGDGMLLTPEGLEGASEVQLFREALVRFAPGVDVGSAVGELGARWELGEREPPREVRDLAELGALPEVLGAFLATLGAVALVHALAVAVRRRARDLAVLRALGVTPSQSAGSIVVMAMTTATVGVVVGAPLGWAVARLVWGEVARGIGVAPDVVVPAGLPLVLVATLLVAGLLALVPARAVARQRPAALLRAE